MSDYGEKKVLGLGNKFSIIVTQQICDIQPDLKARLGVCYTAFVGSKMVPYEGNTHQKYCETANAPTNNIKYFTAKHETKLHQRVNI